MAQTLCKLKKLLKNDLNDYIVHVGNPKFVCKSCGRVANKKNLICKPKKIK